MVQSLDNFTPEETKLRDAAARFAKDVVAPRVSQMDDNETLDREVLSGLFENGLMGIEASTDHGGAGSSFMSYILTIQELAKVDPTVAVVCDVQNTIINAIIRTYGTKEQQDKWVPLLTGSELASFCLSEVNAGSDAFALKTTAKKDSNGDWIINGSKKWCTNAREAGIFVIFAVTDPSQGYGKGVTCFVATKDEAIKIVGQEKNLGIRAASVCTLDIDDLRVPAENVIGPEGIGAKIALDFLNKGRVGMAANMVGLAQGAFDKAVSYTYQRKAFGQAVGTYQSIQHQIAAAATEIETARLLTYNAARLNGEGKNFTKEGAMAKYWAAGVASRVSGLAIEWTGGVGFTRDTGIEKYWRDSKIGAIFEGTSNIQLNTIAGVVQAEHSQH